MILVVIPLLFGNAQQGNVFLKVQFDGFGVFLFKLVHSLEETLAQFTGPKEACLKLLPLILTQLSKAQPLLLKGAAVIAKFPLNCFLNPGISR